MACFRRGVNTPKTYVWTLGGLLAGAGVPDQAETVVRALRAYYPNDIDVGYLIGCLQLARLDAPREDQ